jgi:hypothetical protein
MGAILRPRAAGAEICFSPDVATAAPFGAFVKSEFGKQGKVIEAALVDDTHIYG